MQPGWPVQKVISQICKHLGAADFYKALETLSFLGWDFYHVIRTLLCLPKAGASSPLSSAAEVHGSLVGAAEAAHSWHCPSEPHCSFNHGLDVQPSVRPREKRGFCPQWDRIFKLRPLL